MDTADRTRAESNDAASARAEIARLRRQLADMQAENMRLRDAEARREAARCEYVVTPESELLREYTIPPRN